MSETVSPRLNVSYGAPVLLDSPAGENIVPPHPDALTNDVVCSNCGMTLVKIPPNVEVVPSEGTLLKCGSCGKTIDLSPSKA